MRALIYPFYSQQDKATGRHLPTCGNVKQMAFIARKLTEIGWKVRVPVPHTLPRSFPTAAEWRVYVPSNNRAQRLHWDTKELEELGEGCDLAVCCHEFMSIPLRALFPKLKLVQMCSVEVDSSLFLEAWKCADLVVFQHESARRGWSLPKSTAWTMAYDSEQLPQLRGGDRPIDVCFVQRASASNYSHHLEFMEAAKGRPWSVVYADPTKYLRAQHPELVYVTDPVSGYYYTLRRSKVAVSLCSDGFASQSIREAVRMGCAPVLLFTEASKALAGPNWIGYCSESPDSIREAVEKALGAGGPPQHAVDAVASQSYQAAWLRIQSDLEGLL